MKEVINALRQQTYSISEEFNGDAFHIIEAHLQTSPENLSLDQLIMLLNMCRVIRNGKEAKMPLAYRAALAALHPTFPERGTLKAAREYLSEAEKRLEREHGKYATKSALMKTKYATQITYREEWLAKITSFTEVCADYKEVTPAGGEVEAYESGQERISYDARGREWRSNTPSKSPLDIFMKR